MDLVIHSLRQQGRREKFGIGGSRCKEHEDCLSVWRGRVAEGAVIFLQSKKCFQSYQ